MKRLLLFLVILTIPIKLLSQSIPDGVYATIYMGEDQIFMELFYKDTPMTVANFVGLAEGTISNVAFEKGRPFFDGSSFDRVVPGHVIQGGVPNSENATGTGYTIPNEINEKFGHGEAGMVGMANAGPHTGSNVFYITLGDRSYLDGDYTVFGSAGNYSDDFVELNTRIDSIRILRVGADAEAFQPNDETLAALIKKVQKEVDEKEATKKEFEDQYIATNYPELLTSKSGWQYQVLKKGKGKPAGKREQVEIIFTGVTPQGMMFCSQGDESTSYREDEEEGTSIEYIIGSSKINKGLDEAILKMKPGSKWIVVLKPEFAYGKSGYYSPNRDRLPRFHFSPNTTLIYTIEIVE